MHMRLTWRDAVSTGLVVAGLAAALSVVYEWGWPLLGGVRAGIIALAVAGLGSCVFGSSLDRFYFKDPYGVITGLIAVATLAISIVGGLIFGTAEFMYALMVIVGMLWAMATLRHAVEGREPVPSRTRMVPG
jgi:hypothetical protein